MKEDQVKIKHWVQHTIESGSYELTVSMSKSNAKRLIELDVYVDAEIITQE